MTDALRVILEIGKKRRVVTRKVEVRTPREVVLTSDGRAAHREATLDAILA